MVSLQEALPTSSELAGTLAAGVRQISEDQTIDFVKYTRIVLPIDGYVVWVRTSLLSSNALSFALGIYGRPVSGPIPEQSDSNALSFSLGIYGRPVSGKVAPARAGLARVVEGSLHYATDQQQREDETIGINRMVLTSLEEIQEFNQVASGTIFIGSFDGLRFAFTRRRSLYRQAGLFHYEGDAIYPVMETQIIDDLADLDRKSVIVSNSLPIWLSFQQPQKWPQPYNPQIPVYPSFLVPDNIRPPYATAHIPAETTQALQSQPLIDATTSHYQLVRERVRFTLYGLRNHEALRFQDFLFQYSVDTGKFGIMNTPVMRDEKRTQSELNILAMKKTFDIDVAYYQQDVEDIARQYIFSWRP